MGWKFTRPAMNHIIPWKGGNRVEALGKSKIGSRIIYY